MMKQEATGINHLTPSEAVDPAIHYFLDFTAEWREFSAALTGGKSIDRISVVNESITSGRERPDVRAEGRPRGRRPGVAQETGARLVR
jgi:hypothetical protein